MAKSLNSFVNDMKDIAKPTKKSGKAVSQARLDAIAKSVEEDIKSFMNEIKDNAANEYYNGYTPTSYHHRTYQLPNALEVKVESKIISADTFTVTWRFSADNVKRRMKHYSGSKRKKHKADEELILENYLAGEHPNAKGSWSNGVIEDSISIHLAEASTVSEITKIVSKYIEPASVQVTKKR